MPEADSSLVVRPYRCHISVERGQRGGYGWTISVRDDDADVVLRELKRIDEKLRADWGPGRANGEAST